MIRQQYNQLVELLRKVSHLRGIEAVLSWDQQVMMPKKGGVARGHQMSLLAGMIHDLETDERIGQLLTSVEQHKQELNPYETSLIYLARKNYDRKVKVPKDLVEKAAKLSADGYEVWVESRRDNDWNKFAPVLKEWISLRKQIVAQIDSNKDDYDMCLDEYESGLTKDRLDTLFSDVKQFLIPFIQQISQAKQQGKQVDTSFLTSTDPIFDIKRQEELSRSIARDFGFSFESGRIDASVHPFSTGISYDDVRITTRYQTNEFLQALAGTMHETGHGLYEQNLNKEYEGTPVASPLSMGVHESQSLFWERHVGLSKQFFKHYWPVLKQEFAHLPDLPIDHVYAAANVVEPIFIRVESDEVTYPLHIILRYEIERGLFDGTIEVDDLPQVWNSKMQEYLGITPSNYAQGVLQDVHWGIGYFGYFPTYLLGAMYAAQIASKLPDFETNLDNRNFTAIRDQLIEKIHKRGSVDLNADELLRNSTGEPLNSQHFINYLKYKYNEIYQLQ
jgi:carboxypeptidase Taq